MKRKAYFPRFFDLTIDVGSEVDEALQLMRGIWARNGVIEIVEGDDDASRDNRSSCPYCNPVHPVLG